MMLVTSISLSKTCNTKQKKNNAIDEQSHQWKKSYRNRANALCFVVYEKKKDKHRFPQVGLGVLTAKDYIPVQINLECDKKT